MKPSILETICGSLILHLGLLFVLSQAPEKRSEPIQLNIIENPSTGQKPLKPSTRANYAKPRQTEKSSTNSKKTGLKEEKIDLRDYANRVKLKVDPIWLDQIHGYREYCSGKCYLEVLVRISPLGEILSTKILKSSGHSGIDEAAIRTFKIAISLPKPPNSPEILRDGIIWEFNL